MTHDEAYSDDQPLSRSRLVELLSAPLMGVLPVVTVDTTDAEDADPEAIHAAQHAVLRARHNFERMRDEAQAGLMDCDRALDELGEMLR